MGSPSRMMYHQKVVETCSLRSTQTLCSAWMVLAAPTEVGEAAAVAYGKW